MLYVKFGGQEHPENVFKLSRARLYYNHFLFSKSDQIKSTQNRAMKTTRIIGIFIIAFLFFCLYCTLTLHTFCSLVVLTDLLLYFF